LTPEISDNGASACGSRAIFSRSAFVGRFHIARLLTGQLDFGPARIGGQDALELGVVDLPADTGRQRVESLSRDGRVVDLLLRVDARLFLHIRQIRLAEGMLLLRKDEIGAAHAGGRDEDDGGDALLLGGREQRYGSALAVADDGNPFIVDVFARGQELHGGTLIV
jgi:hypothetical protein